MRFDDEDEADEDDDDEVDTPFYLQTGKLYITTRQHVPEMVMDATQINLDRNSGSIRQKSNVVMDSLGTLCLKLFKQGNSFM